MTSRKQLVAIAQMRWKFILSFNVVVADLNQNQHIKIFQPENRHIRFSRQIGFFCSVGYLLTFHKQNTYFVHSTRENAKVLASQFLVVG